MQGVLAGGPHPPWEDHCTLEVLELYQGCLAPWMGKYHAGRRRVHQNLHRGVGEREVSPMLHSNVEVGLHPGNDWSRDPGLVVVVNPVADPLRVFTLVKGFSRW